MVCKTLITSCYIGCSRGYQKCQFSTVLHSFFVLSYFSGQLSINEARFNRKSDSELWMQFQPFPLVLPLIVLAFFSRFPGAAFHI